MLIPFYQYNEEWLAHELEESLRIFAAKNGTDILAYIEIMDENFSCDRVLDARPAASLKAGGVVTRFTCRILNHQTYLFKDDDTWFVEGIKIS